jgi:hypothetical protein
MQEECWPTPAREKAGNRLVEDEDPSQILDSETGSRLPQLLKGADTLEEIRFTSIRRNKRPLLEQKRLLPKSSCEKARGKKTAT